jgi:hypothetical protein
VGLLAAHRFGPGRRWPLLRAAAEAVRRELYTYRTATGPYAPDGGDAEGADGTGAAARDATLAARLGAIDAGLLQTEAAAGSLPPYGGPLPPPWAGTAPADDGLSPLDPPAYLELRLAELLGACRARVALAGQQRRRLQLVLLAAGVAGTVLAVTHQELWVALSTAVLLAAGASPTHLHAESDPEADNRAAASLEATHARWLALPPAERDQHRFTALVEQTEAAADPGLAPWTRQLADAISAAQTLATPPAIGERERDTPDDHATGDGPSPDSPSRPGGSASKRSPAARLTGLFNS